MSDLIPIEVSALRAVCLAGRYVTSGDVAVELNQDRSRVVSALVTLRRRELVIDHGGAGAARYRATELGQRTLATVPQ